jgi:hypothetical protein
MDGDVVALFKQGGVALVALVMLGYIIKKIGERMIGSIDKLTERSDANTKVVSDSLITATTTITTSVNRQSEATVTALGGLSERVARVEGRIEGIAGSRGEIFDEPTPVEAPEVRGYRKAMTPAHGHPSLPYGPSRPKTNG